MHAHASPREWDSDASSADAELERRTVACELCEEVDRRADDLGAEHRAPVVVARRDLFAEVILLTGGSVLGDQALLHPGYHACTGAHAVSRVRRGVGGGDPG